MCRYPHLEPFFFLMAKLAVQILTWLPNTFNLPSSGWDADVEQLEMFRLHLSSLKRVRAKLVPTGSPNRDEGNGEGLSLAGHAGDMSQWKAYCD